MVVRPDRRTAMPGRYDSPPDLDIDLDAQYEATLHTTLGDITIAFLPAEAPVTTNNFLFLAGDGYYDGVVFHRIVPGFVIQGGDPSGTGTGGPGYTFRDELDGSGRYARGTVAMANAGPNTNGSQFFICLDDVGLPHAYTIFGTVTAGMDVVDAIAALPTGAQDRPHDPPVIQSVTVTTP
jgi:cyclophilin family peptidyl-prolyl cis-trans isomerase